MWQDQIANQCHRSPRVPAHLRHLPAACRRARGAPPSAAPTIPSTHRATRVTPAIATVRGPEGVNAAMSNGMMAPAAKLAAEATAAWSGRALPASVWPSSSRDGCKGILVLEGGGHLCGELRRQSPSLQRWQTARGTLPPVPRRVLDPRGVDRQSPYRIERSLTRTRRSPWPSLPHSARPRQLSGSCCGLLQRRPPQPAEQRWTQGRHRHPARRP